LEFLLVQLLLSVLELRAKEGIVIAVTGGDDGVILVTDEVALEPKTLLAQPQQILPSVLFFIGDQILVKKGRGCSETLLHLLQNTHSHSLLRVLLQELTLLLVLGQPVEESIVELET
jgi:hypothetical protein